MRRRIKPGSRPVFPHCGPTGKVMYKSERAALRALDAVQAKRAAKKRPEVVEAMECRAYRCTFGMHWHLTKSAA